MKQMVTSKYFKEEEFKRCSPSCSLQDMDQDFMNKLDALREAAGIPLVITSAYRPVAWEKSKGRSGTGDHPQRCAVDIRCNTSVNRYKILKAAFALGFRRIGVANGFIHVGTGNNLPQDVVWMY
jgi:uncharacterized protein YcbK (DUF882 family)